MRPFLYLLMIGFMAYLVWMEDAAQQATSAEASTSREPPESKGINRASVTAILPHGDVVYTGDEVGTIRMISPGKSDAAQHWVAHLGAIRQLQLRGTRLISVGADGSVATWSSDGVPERRARLVGHHLNAAAITERGATIVAADRGTVARVDVGHRWRIAGIHARAAFSVSLDPTELQVISGGADGSLRIWEVADGEEVHTWVAHKGWVTQAVWGSDAVWSAGSDGRLRAWDTQGNRRHDLAASDNAITSMVRSADHIATGSESGDVRVFNSNSGLEVWRGRVDGAVMSLGIGSDRLYVGEEDGSVSIWDMTNGRSIGTLPDD